MVVKCQKTKFATEKDAQFYIDKLRATSNREKVPVRSYLCRCGSWHLTSRKDFMAENAALSNRIAELERLLSKMGGTLPATGDSNEKTIRQLKEENQKNKKLIKLLRKDNADLVGRIVQLEKNNNGRQQEGQG